MLLCEWPCSLARDLTAAIVLGAFYLPCLQGPITTSIKLRIHPKELFGLLFIFHTLSFWMIDASVHGLIP